MMMNGTFVRIAFFFFTCYMFCPNNVTDSFSGFKLTSYHDKAVENNTRCFQNITEPKISSCFEHCLRNCKCKSFQICGGVCQLCYGELETLHDQTACSYFNFTVDDKVAKQQCQRGCARGTNCCMTSQPCLNGGTCIPEYFTANSSRFTCLCTKESRGEQCEECAEGYTGELCQTPIKSCRGYKNENGVVQEYKIFDNNMKLFPVMCQYDDNRSWTLIHSFKFQNHEREGMKTSFASDADLKQREDNPNLQFYRMSKFRMKGVAEDSSKWRITCNYKKNQISKTDYVEASLENANILTFNGNRCVPVDFINIRGIECTNCTAYMIQSHNRQVNRYIMGLHFDSKLGPSFSCQHNASEGSQTCGTSGEDDFGFYDCHNTNHRCSEKNTSITSTWFGG